MNLYHRAIQQDRLDPHVNDLLALQFSEHTIQHAIHGPAVHSRIGRVPLAKTPGLPTPFSAVLGHVKNRIEHLQVRQADIAAQSREAMFNPLILSFGDFHHRSIRSDTRGVNTP
jgi:hypothetical protein